MTVSLGMSHAIVALITILSMVTESKSVSTRRSGLTIVFKKVVVPPTKKGIWSLFIISFLRYQLGTLNVQKKIRNARDHSFEF